MYINTIGTVEYFYIIKILWRYKIVFISNENLINFLLRKVKQFKFELA